MNAQVVQENEVAIVYYMPKTQVQITLDYEMTEQQPGPFYQYAERYLGAKNIITEAKTHYQLTGIHSQVISCADTDRAYKITAQKGVDMQLIQLTEDGRLAAVNGGEGRLMAVNGGEDRFMAVNGGEGRLSVNEEVMPLLEGQFMAGSVAKMAEGAAKQIYHIRETRLNILAGDVEHVPADGQAMQLVLDELKKQEQSLVELFIGKTSYTQHSHTLLYTPAESVEKEVICRLSQHQGIVSPQDLSGEPIYLTLDAHYQALLPGTGEINPKEPQPSQLHYNLPGWANLSISYKNKTLAEETLTVAQYGVAVPLTQDLFTGKKQASIRFNTQTGNILHIQK
jgi:hypothetical protein